MTPYVADPDFTLYLGDVVDVLAELPSESVQMCVTSPPYWGLRDYGVEGQIGLEPTPDAYVARMVAVFREVRRVLRRDGTCWLNIGDSYAGHNLPDWRPGNEAKNQGNSNKNGVGYVDGLKPKDLCGIPWRLAFALQADGWYLRADIIWAKPNPMPESVTDRPTKAHEYLFLLAKQPHYYYDADAIREAYTNSDKNAGRGPDGRRITTVKAQDGSAQHRDGERWPNPSGRNKRSVWEIATEAYPDAHFATFPQALVEPCILAGTSERGCCPECGAPWEREADVSHERDGSGTTGKARNLAEPDGRTNGTGFTGKPKMRKVVETTGWRPTCDHVLDDMDGLHYAEPVPCVVLDPFLGSGTTALVARRLGRRCVGLELNAEYARLAAKRLSQLSLLADEAA